MIQCDLICPLSLQTGYGASTGDVPSEKYTYADIEAVIDWTCKELSIKDPQQKVSLVLQDHALPPSILPLLTQQLDHASLDSIPSSPPRPSSFRLF